jgi:chaperonin GroEL
VQYCTSHSRQDAVESLEQLQVCENDEQRMGADIVRKALPYALKLIAHNAGINGSVVMDKVLSKSSDVNFGYNAATDVYEDLMAAGIIDPTKVIRCCLENATSVARTFLMADCVVTEIPELEDPAAAGAPGGMEMGGY